MKLAMPSLCAATILSLACSPGADGPPGPDAAWVGTITTEGDVTTVVNESGSVWGGAGRLVEEASIGVDAGAEEYMLGNIAGIGATDEHIYLVDPSVPVVRVYTRDGAHVRDIGGRGQGPGEFNNPRSIAIGPDGTLYVYGDRRINLYSAEGESIDTWPFSTGFSSGDPPVMAVDGTLYFHDLVESGDIRNWKHGMIAAGPDGAHGDHIRVPEIAFEPYVLIREIPGGSTSSTIPFGPRLVWTMAPTRAMVAGVGDEYEFEIHHPDGRVTIVRKYWDPVPVSGAEADWNRTLITSYNRADDPEWRWDGPSIPAHKPAFSSLHADPGGNVWVQRTVRTDPIEPCDPDPLEPAGDRPIGCWRQVQGFDVFDPDGRYLGPVPIPSGITFRRPVIRGDTFIAYNEDEDGVGYVKRYRLRPPDES